MAALVAIVVAEVVAVEGVVALATAVAEVVAEVLPVAVAEVLVQVASPHLKARKLLSSVVPHCLLHTYSHILYLSLCN